MTRRVTTAAAAALFAATGLLSGAAAAQDKAPVILIVNQQQVLATSKAGQSIQSQLQKLQQAAEADLNAQVQAMVKEQDDLQKQKSLMAEAVWTEKARALAVKQNNLPALRDVKVRELSISEQQALGKLNESLTPILKRIVDAKGATLLLDRSAVIYGAAETDITAQVIAELDKAISTVPVQKVSLADLQKQAQQQAAQAPALAKKK